MNNTTTGEEQKDKTYYDYILEHRNTIIALIFVISLISLIYFYFIRDTTDRTDTRKYVEVNGMKVPQDEIPPDQLQLGGAIKKLKSQLRNVK